MRLTKIDPGLGSLVDRKPPWLSEPSPIERLRHCWLTANEHGKVPALLLEWRQMPTGWEARVVRPVLDMEDEKSRPREEWLPAESIAPA
jgi:hypothetical protein